MAKKKRATGETRKVLLSSDDLRAEAAQLISFAKSIGEIAKEVDALETKSITVEGKAMLDYSKKYVKRFILNAQRELT
jgi:hypothetical protein